jgi:hypothetical protein
MSAPNHLRAALGYAERLGWPVFPIYGISDGLCACGKADCSRPGKHPIGKLAPRGFLDATTNLDVITAWWSAYPSANIGVPTGAASGLVVLDVDVDMGGFDGLHDIQAANAPLPETAMSLTGGGGYHYLFAHPGDGVMIRNSVRTLGEGLDVRGDGGYIIVPPSSHASGRTYEWEGSCHPTTTPLAALPDWLRGLLIAPPKSTAAPPPRDPAGKLWPRQVARLRAALGYLDPEPYDTWLMVGMALHSTGDPAAFDLWTSWAIASAKFDPDDHARRWESFRRDSGGVSLGSLFAAAKQAGYAPPASEPPPEPPPVDEEPPGPPSAPFQAIHMALRRAKNGEPYGSAANIAEILGNHPAWKGVLAFDAMSNQITKRQPPPYPKSAVGPWKDADEIATAIWLEREFDLRAGGSLISAVANLLARYDEFHEVRAWLDQLPAWDGTDRLTAFFSDYCGSPQTPYTAAVGRAFFVSAVARVMAPGCKVDTMLVLEGEQGIGKSQLILALFGKAWHIEISYAPGSLDFYQALRGTWCAEFGELASFDKSDMSKVKQVLSQVQDTYRASFGHHVETHPRQTIFVGSTNKREWGLDETGLRRFWPIACKEVNLDAIRDMREQLWAEGLARYQAGETWWEIPDAKQEQDFRYDADAWEETVSKWIETRERLAPGPFTVNDVYLGAIHGTNPSRIPPITRADQIRLGRILGRLGWQKHRASGGPRAYHYEKAVS